MANKRHYIWLAIIILLAVVVRLFTIPSVVRNGEVRFSGDGSWYYMHMADWDYKNFPAIFQGDAYQTRQYPASYTPLLPWIIAFITKMLEKVITIPNLLDYVGATIGVVSVIPTLIYVYLLAKILFKSKQVALLSIALVGFLMSQFFTRSLFGNPDSHPFEVLFSTATLYYLRIRKPVKAGIMTGLMMLTWEGGVFLPAIVALAECLRVAKDRIIKPVYTAETGRIPRLFNNYLFTASLVALPLLTLMRHPDAHATLMRYGIIWVGLNMVYIIGTIPAYKLRMTTLCLIPLVGITGALFIKSNGLTLFQNVWDLLLSIFWGFGTTIQECQPPTVDHWLVSYGFPGLTFVFGYLKARDLKLDFTFTVWSAVMFLANLGQRRWGYYFVIPVALFSSYATIWLLPKMRAWGGRFASVSLVVWMLLTTPAVFGVLNTPPMVSDNLYNSYLWLRENTPTTTDYRVLSWWDYGHQIIRVGERVPVTSPSNQYSPLLMFFASQGNEGTKMLEGSNVRYVMITRKMAEEAFSAIAAGFPERGLIPKQVKGWEKLKAGSMITRLWYYSVDGFNPVYQNDEVKIFECLER